MTDTDEQQDRLIRLLSPDLRLPRSVSQPTGPVADELRRLIMAAPGSTANETSTAPAVARRPRTFWSSRRRLVFAAPIVAGLAAVAFLVSAALPDSNPVGPAPARAGVLTFAEDNGYLDITIVDPVADPARYRAELAQHGLAIDLKLAPAAPDQVGRVIFQEEDGSDGPQIKTVEKPGDCSANGDCSVGIRVPLSYRGKAQIVFGRTPKPGETIEGDAPVLSPKQQGQLNEHKGKQVADVRAILAANGQTATYRVGFASREAAADEVPGNWYVYDVAPLANDVVVLWVSADGKEPAPGS
jgi:hypothetical protein